MKRINFFNLYYFLLFIVFFSYDFFAQTRERVSFNEDWLFQKTDTLTAHETNFDDASWRKLSVPHDWAIEGPFKPEYNLRTGGLPVFGMAWYRKHFTIDASKKGQIITLEFDGVMNNSTIYINGKKVYHRPYGYIGFQIDITSFVNYGKKNVVAVSLNPEVLSARWYAGAGIYRNVWLETKNNLHIEHWGTQIATTVINDKKAIVTIETSIENSNVNSSKNTILETSIFDEAGKQVASVSSKIDLNSSKNIKIQQKSTISNPKIWDFETPHLYKVVSKILENNKEIDKYTSSFGVRTISFSRKGFFLNGRKEKIKGVCLHHDLGPLGTAVNYRATERQLQIMKEMGINAIRTSHNPPSPEQLELCDKMGILVQVEAFDGWKIPKTENDYNKYWDEWHETDFRDMIIRNRNHPSIIMWSIGNEMGEQKIADGHIIAKKLVDISHQEDPTRPATAGFNQLLPALKNGLGKPLDFVGANYKPTLYAQLMKQYPDMIIYGSETASTVSSRGVYHLPLEKYEKHPSLQINSYDFNSPSWAYPPDIEFFNQDANPNVIGEFVWTGFDYLGEPTPYGGKDNLTHGNWLEDWPSRSSYFGTVDLAGFPKDRFYLYQSQWTKKPMVHILPHWNWENSGVTEIPIYCYTNAEEAELFVNGKSQGKKIKGVDKTRIPVDFFGWNKKEKYFDSPYRLSWNVPFEAGEIEIVAYNQGKEVARKSIKTAKKAAQILMIPDRNVINADGEDLSFITIKIEDEDGTFVPLADNLVNFKITGPTSIAAVGNGDATSTEPFQASYRKAFNGLCLLVLKSKKGETGEITIEASSKGLKTQTIKIQTK
jgi:beta-galactosidase